MTLEVAPKVMTSNVSCVSSRLIAQCGHGGLGNAARSIVGFAAIVVSLCIFALCLKGPHTMAHIQQTGNIAPMHHHMLRFFERLMHAPFFMMSKCLHWFQMNTFAPCWISQRWHPLLVGYGAALLLQIALSLLAMIVVTAFSPFNIIGSILFFGVLVIALLWGAGPALLAIFVGAISIVEFHENMFLRGSFGGMTFLVIVGLYAVMAMSINILVSQTAHARQVAYAALRDAERNAQSLQREKMRLDAVIDAVPDKLSIQDTQGTLIQMNQAAREGVGMSDQPLPPHMKLDKLPLWAANGLRVTAQDLPLASVARGERIEGMEYVEYLATGQKKYLSLSMAPIAPTDGGAGGVVVISHDVTGLKQAQQAESQRANELEALFNSMTDAVMVFDVEGRIVRANAAYRRLSTHPQIVEWSLRQRQTHFDIRNERGEVLRYEELPIARILRGEVLQGATAADLQIHPPEQELRYLNTTGAPLRNEAGAIIGGVYVLRDITERHQLEKRARDALDAMVIIASDIVRIPSEQEPSAESAAQRIAKLTCHVLNCQRVVIAAMDTATDQLHFVAMTGFTSEQVGQLQRYIEGVPLDTFISLEQMAQLRRGNVVTVNLAMPALTVMDFVSPRALLAPIMLENRLMGTLTISLETSDRPIPAEDIMVAATIAKLAALVLEREQLLQQQATAQARILALQQAKERMDIFLNMASHELRTPLTSVIGYIQLARKRLARLHETVEGSQDSQVMTLLNDADSQTVLLNRLIGDLLEAARVEKRSLSLHSVVCDVTAIVEVAIHGQQAAWPNREIALQGAEATPLLVQGDKERILQVMTNYLTNALKYSLADTPVTVRLQREGERIRVLVTDKGPGMSVEDQGHIWEQFYRVEGVTTQSGTSPGLGLGLYLSRAIIEQHGGEVGVESRLGEGSTFWFTLPMYHEAS